MAFLGTAAQRVMACRRPLSPLCRVTARCYSSQSTHTTEKSVPYEKTLKQEDGLSGPTKPLPKSADVVVIGGGSLGCQTLYHLCKMGMTNVVLLERDRLTAGTTWHTAGIQRGQKWFWMWIWSELCLHCEFVFLHCFSKSSLKELFFSCVNTSLPQFCALKAQRNSESGFLCSLKRLSGLIVKVLSHSQSKVFWV